ncbi:hypothetical protein BT96DRAFT_842444, partial [Gymnopus androsaceus JB14]
WNSTYDMLAAFLEMKDPVSEFLDHSLNGLVEYLLDKEEWDAIEGLFQILKDATTFFSTNAPIIAAVIPAMDAINEAFVTGIIDKQVLSDPIRHALSIGKKTLNKYYTLTKDSDIYCMAMGTYFLSYFKQSSNNHIVLHPSLKLNYFRNAGWMDAWIEEAVAVT